MRGRPMTHSLAFVQFLPTSHVPDELFALADQEGEIIAKIEALNNEVKAIREKTKDMLLDVTPRMLAKAKADVAAAVKAADEAEKQAAEATQQ